MGVGHQSTQPTTVNDNKQKVWQKRGKRLAPWAQIIGALISALALLIAIWVATQGQMTVNHNSQNTLRQSEDSQLSTAITAL